jgi:hypothetical protein
MVTLEHIVKERTRMTKVLLNIKTQAVRHRHARTKTVQAMTNDLRIIEGLVDGALEALKNA